MGWNCTDSAGDWAGYRTVSRVAEACEEECRVSRCEGTGLGDPRDPVGSAVHNVWSSEAVVAHSEWDCIGTGEERGEMEIVCNGWGWMWGRLSAEHEGCVGLHERVGGTDSSDGDKCGCW